MVIGILWSTKILFTFALTLGFGKYYRSLLHFELYTLFYLPNCKRQALIIYFYSSRFVHIFGHIVYSLIESTEYMSLLLLFRIPVTHKSKKTRTVEIYTTQLYM